MFFGVFRVNRLTPVSIKLGKEHNCDGSCLGIVADLSFNCSRTDLSENHANCSLFSASLYFEPLRYELPKVSKRL